MSELFAERDTKKLKLGLLAGSVVVALLTSAIFLAIAYRLASDMGGEIYERSASNEANVILRLVQAMQVSGTTGGRPDPSEVLQRLFASGHFDAEYLRLRLGETEFVEGAEVLGDEVSSQWSWSPEDDADSRIFEFSGKSYVFAQARNAQNSVDVLLVKRIDEVESALKQLLRRLILASLLIFWLAVWAALIVTGIIAKRISMARDRLVYEATHDSLTGLGNRAMFFDRCNRHIERRETSEKGPSAALMIVDLDNFKEVNETAGPEVGDRLLTQIADRLALALPKGSALYRYGGDEFAIWLDPLDEVQARRFAEKLVELCHQPIEIDDWCLGLGASVGVARFPEDGGTFTELLRCADIALLQAKRLRCGVRFFTSSDDPSRELKVALRSQLRQAILDEQFVLFYQPKIKLKDHGTSGFEALARWNHPVHGMLLPGLFMDLIEQGGLVNLFSRHVLREAIRQARDWLDQGQEVPIAVNLSSYNLLDVSLVDYIRETLEELQVPGRLLEIELTESAAMFDVDLAQNIFSALRAEGVSVAIDDFGTGMSSLAYLKSLDVDSIKIDRSFIGQLENSPTDQAIVGLMVNLCQNLGYKVVAEGVETAEQARLLREMGCDQAQGFFFGKPMAVDAATLAVV